MPPSDIPAEAPPSYQQATGSSAASHPTLQGRVDTSHPTASGSTNLASATDTPTSKTHLEVPGSGKDSNGIPAAHRRSMEDEARPLPTGWVRTFDPSSHHQFFVDTTKEPPRSIWVHPYDDEEYLASLPAEERERIEEESMNRGHGPNHSKEDIMAAHTDDEDEAYHPSSSTAELPPREGKGKGRDTRTFGRKFKDKITGMTHEEREVERKKRAQYERQLYQQHLAIRRAMGEAMRTGQPQHVGKDGDGKDIYIEPPAPPQGYGGGYGGGYMRGANMYDPYGRGGVYTTPDARYIRPPNPYSRPMGGGFGGGYGLPLMLGGGLLGGAMLGNALF
ncbi:hypothetical protein LTR37_011629 [Vermiconidia calcicola]|uniref:Uncharacterized protein n=1 Tax=Vermiconidia calcicola TaxID=1690605 RepID=A0ACC3N1G4_9PEZI|nr:hypothetical protein LTR37_011629 [Vermiconidia calcicola]